jgi:hypothetical protein
MGDESQEIVLTLVTIMGSFKGESRDVLLEEKDQYSLPPCTNKFRSAPIDIDNFIYISLTKQAT